MVRKAVITAAGYGTRFLPVTKAVNKCMLPILTRPLVHLAVADCAAAGITEIALVVRSGDDLVRRYFTDEPEPAKVAGHRLWQERHQSVAELAAFTILEQPDNGRYGSALPVLAARAFIDGDDFVVIAPDDVILREDGGSETADLVRTFYTGGSAGAVAATTVPGPYASGYGVLSTREGKAGAELTSITEKPADHPISEPARVYVGRAVVSADFFHHLDALVPDPPSYEYQITTALAALARTSPVVIHDVRGAYYNCGEVGGWLAANQAAARIAHVPPRPAFGL